MSKENNKRATESTAQKVSIFAIKGILKIIVLILLVILLIRATFYVYDLSYNVFSDKPNITGEKRDYKIEIVEGMDIDRIAEILKINGIITDKTEFKIRAKLAGLSKTIKLGIHSVNSYMTGEEIMNSLSQEGDNPSEK